MTLELKNVSVRRRGGWLLQGISTLLDARGIVGLVGPNGAGKTTLLNAIATLSPFNGTIRWNGEPVDIRRIGYLPQQCQVQADLSIIETLLLGAHEHLGWRVGDDSLASAIQTLAYFGMENLHARSMQTLSGGQQQSVAIARTRLSDARLILMDEPTAAISVRQVAEVLNLIHRLRDSGIAVILISHRMPDVFAVCERVVVMRRGTKVADKRIAATSPEEVTALITGALEAA